MARAAALYEQLIAEQTDRPDFLNELPLCYKAFAQLQTRRGATKEAKQTAQRLSGLAAKVPAKSPNAAEIRSNLALALTDIGQFEEAISLCKETIRQNPDYPLAHFDLARALSGQGRLDEAIDSYKTATRLNPGHALGYTNLASCLHVAGRLDEAVETYRKSLELEPGRRESYTGLVNTLSEQGKFGQAETVCRDAIKLFPTSWDIYAGLGRAMREQGKLAEAKDAWSKAIALNPNNANLLNEIAWPLATASNPQRRDVAQAVELGTKAVELEPHNGNILNTLGVAQYRNSEFQKALDSLNKAMNMCHRRRRLRLALSGDVPTGSLATKTKPAPGMARRSNGWRRTNPTI